MTPANTSNAPESPQNGEKWLSVPDAAAALRISTKTLRKRIAAGAVKSRRVVLARGGIAFEVEMERSKPKFQTDPQKFHSDFHLDAQKFQTDERDGSRDGRLLSVKSTGLEPGMEVEMEPSISTSIPTPKSSISVSTSSETEVELLREALTRERENGAFLKGVIEQLQRDGAETRQHLKRALELAPKQLAAPLDEHARNAPQRPQNGAAGIYDPGASNGAQRGGEPLSYGDIADMIEQELNQ